MCRYNTITYITYYFMLAVLFDSLLLTVRGTLACSQWVHFFFKDMLLVASIFSLEPMHGRSPMLLMEQQGLN